MRPGGHHGPSATKPGRLSMPPSVQKQLLAKGGCGTSRTRAEDQKSSGSSGTADQKMLLDIAAVSGTRRPWSAPEGRLVLGGDVQSLGASPLADAGALQDFLFKPLYGGVLNARVRSNVFSAALRPRRPSYRCGPDERMGHKRHVLVKDRGRALPHAEHLGRLMEKAVISLSSSRRTTARRAQSLLQDAFGDAVVFMDGHGTSPGRTTVEESVEALAENYVLSTCAAFCSMAGTPFRSIAAARALEPRPDGEPSRAFVEGRKHVAASGARAACSTSVSKATVVSEGGSPGRDKASGEFTQASAQQAADVGGRSARFPVRRRRTPPYHSGPFQTLRKFEHRLK